MKNLKNQFASLLIVAVAFASCSDDDATLDTQKPTISIEKPTVHQEVEPGSQLQLRALLQDETALASYKVEIHSAGDGHEHKPAQLKAGADFHYDQTFQIPGNVKTHQVDYVIDIPLDAAQDHYHLGIFCIDAAGNQTQQFIEIFIGEEHVH